MGSEHAYNIRSIDNYRINFSECSPNTQSGIYITPRETPWPHVGGCAWLVVGFWFGQLMYWLCCVVCHCLYWQEYDLRWLVMLSNCLESEVLRYRLPFVCSLSGMIWASFLSGSGDMWQIAEIRPPVRPPIGCDYLLILIESAWQFVGAWQVRHR